MQIIKIISVVMILGLSSFKAYSQNNFCVYTKWIIDNSTEALTTQYAHLYNNELDRFNNEIMEISEERLFKLSTIYKNICG